MSSKGEDGLSELVIYVEPLPPLFDPLKIFDLSKDELEPYLILLTNHDSPEEVRWGCLENGSTVDACFGTSPRASFGLPTYDANSRGEEWSARSAAEAKAYLRHLPESKHGPVIHFYRTLFQELLSYHRKVGRCGVCALCMRSGLQEKVVTAIGMALTMLRESLREDGDGEEPPQEGTFQRLQQPII
ncbi:unnamed protein product [Discosporangium mesarthrocarpum]